MTLRTAGFNTLDYAAMEESTTVMTMALMLVGGGPSSTAGGIKVTTRIVLALATLAFFRQQGRLHIFGGSPGISEIMEVLALTSIFLILIGLFLTSLIFCSKSAQLLAQSVFRAARPGDLMNSVV